ncbi:MAG TPA: hypothetical protein VFW92_10760 [Candidatus Limnocylindrales bacterium]|nr:hypothetical protein [Candidatus Limnocylindrales bacterium]
MSDRAGRLTLTVGALIVLLGALAALLLGPRLGGALRGPDQHSASGLDVAGDWQPVAWSPDGQRLLVGGSEGLALVGRGTAPPSLAGVTAAAWRPGAGHELGVIRPASPSAARASLEVIDDAGDTPAIPLSGDGQIGLAWSSDGDSWLTWGPNGPLIGRLGAGRSVALPGLGEPLAVSPDGRLVAGRDRVSGAVVLASANGLSRRILPGATVTADGALGFSPDGIWLAVGDAEHGLRIAPVDGQAPPTLVAVAADPASVAWAPAGERLVALRTGQPASGAILVSVRSDGIAVQPLGPAAAVAWAVDGGTIVVLTPDGQVRAVAALAGGPSASPGISVLATDAVPGCTPRRSASGVLAYCAAGRLRVVGP